MLWPFCLRFYRVPSHLRFARFRYDAQHFGQKIFDCLGKKRRFFSFSRFFTFEDLQRIKCCFSVSVGGVGLDALDLTIAEKVDSEGGDFFHYVLCRMKKGIVPHSDLPAKRLSFLAVAGV